MALKLKEKIGYGLGDMASSMFWKLFGMYLLFFYTDIFGIPAATVGTMFLVTRIWDSLNDPIMGILADRTQTRWGKFRPYLLWMALPFGVIGILTFTTPDWDEARKVIYAYFTYTAMMMVYTAINVPYASLLGVISPDSRERTTLSSYRMFFAYAGSFLALMLIEPLVNYFTQGTPGLSIAKSWQAAAGVLAVLCVLLFLGCFLLTRERVKPQLQQKHSLKKDITDLIRNKPWWILLGSGITALIFNSIRDGATVYYFKYYILQAETIRLAFWNLSVTWCSFYLMLGQVANMLGVACAAPIANRIGKRITYLVAMTIATLLSVLFYWLQADQLTLIFIFQFFISFCAGIIFPLLWSMYADIADYSELKNGRRATGLIFSSSSMSQKLGWTIGGAVTGWLLAYFGFEANAVQTETAQSGIRMMLSFFPAMGTFLSVLCMFFYPLTEKKIKKIENQLVSKSNVK